MALSTVLKDKKLYEGNENMENVELNKFYIKTLKRTMSHFINKKVYIFNCYRENEEKEKEYTLCCFSEENDVKIYLFSKKDKQFLEVDIDKMSKLQQQGLVLGAKPKENGSNKLKKYIKRYDDKQRVNYDNEINI